MTRTRFVGRAAELGVLEACLADALSGHPRVVLCQGEAGIGKTRLSEELLSRARSLGVLAAWGGADDVTGSPPYWPWRLVLRALSRGVEIVRIAQALGLTADIARFAPELFQPANPAPESPANADDRFRQFDALARLLHHVCLEVPVAIVVEDAHWADEPSLLLLRHITRGLTNERLLILVNARDLERKHGVRLGQLLREPIARQIILCGLTEPAIREQLAAILERSVQDAEVAQVATWTGGNPFFVGEVGRAMASGPSIGSTPLVTPGLREAIAAHLERLTPQCARAVGFAAILGKQFSIPVLAAMLELAPMPTLELMSEAERAGLVEIAAPTDQFRFVHALVADAVVAGFTPAERIRLHRLAAESIEHHYANRLEPHVFDIARHWVEAGLEGEAPTAVRWLEQAGNQAMQQLAYEEAVRYFARALEIGTTSLADIDRCRLLLALGSAMNLSGDYGGRLAACLDAAALARRAARPDLLAAAALLMDPVGQPGFDIATRRLCQEALAGLAADQTSLRARTAARFAETFIYLPGAEAAAVASEQALELAEQSEDPRALAAALRARNVACAGPDGLDTRARLADRMLALGLECCDINIEFSARRWRMDVAFEHGDLAAVASEIGDLARCAGELGGPLARFTVLHSRAALAQAQGRFAEALTLADEAFVLMAPTDHPARFHTRTAVLGFVARHIGQDIALRAARVFAEAPVEVRDAAGLIAGMAQAHALLIAGRTQDAADAYRAFGPVKSWRPPAHVTLLTHAIGIALAIGVGDPVDVALLADQLKAYRGHHVVSGIGAIAYFGPVELWLGVAAHRLGLLNEAIAELEQADAIATASGTFGFQVEIRCELASALLNRERPGDTSRARTLLSATERQARALGMAPFVQQIIDLQRKLQQAQTIPLTPREWEVAQLVSEGLTNRGIADRLCLSERTVQNHVQHTLDKLGLANRSQITRMFAARELSRSPE